MDVRIFHTPLQVILQVAKKWMKVNCRGRYMGKNSMGRYS
jgi:hypothetical protein